MSRATTRRSQNASEIFVKKGGRKGRKMTQHCRERCAKSADTHMSTTRPWNFASPRSRNNAVSDRQRDIVVGWCSYPNQKGRGPPNWAPKRNTLLNFPIKGLVNKTSTVSGPIASPVSAKQQKTQKTQKKDTTEKTQKKNITQKTQKKEKTQNTQNKLHNNVDFTFLKFVFSNFAL